VALPEELPVGSTVDRWDWPAHVTLASNFTVRSTLDEITHTVSEVLAGEGTLTARLTGSAMFGPAHDVPVRLVESPTIVDLHERLSARLHNSRGFSADEPAYWGVGFRPHVTLTPRVSVNDAQRLELRNVVLAELTGRSATVLATWRLQRSDVGKGQSSA
jgi:2'-5' RNA ligase